MEQVNSPNNRFVGFPFYIFISLLLGTLAYFGAQAVLQSTSWVTALGYAFLFFVHIGLYWLNLRWFENRKWSLFYYLVQAGLIVGLVSFPYDHESLKGTILASGVICLIGDALGLWGNTKKSLWIGVTFAALALVLLYFVVRPDNYWLAVSSVLVNGGFIVLFMVILNQQLTERQKAVELAESLESANAKLAAYNAKIESLTLQNERQRMARELHDTLAQGVAGLVLQLEAVKAHLKADRPERAVAIVEQSITRARSTLAESRAAIDDLRAVPINVADAVREQVEHFKQSTGMLCELDISVTENQIPVETTNHALNILSESLTNIARHAEATKVKVNFFIQKQTLELEVRDNGKGFDVKQESKGHYGLVGMHERARLTGGMLSIESDANGTCVQFIVGGES